MSRVVTVADTALALTIAEIAEAEAWTIWYKNTLKYIFSTTQATCPVNPKITNAHQKRDVFFFCCITFSSWIQAKSP